MKISNYYIYVPVRKKRPHYFSKYIVFVAEYVTKSIKIMLQNMNEENYTLENIFSANAVFENFILLINE